MSILTVRNLGHAYGPQDIFSGLSFEIPRGARIALVGPNGSGKTTLLRLIAGLDSPTEGVVHRARSVRIVYLPQQVGEVLDLSDNLSGNGSNRTLRSAMSTVFADLLAQAEELRRLEAAMTDPHTYEEALARYGPALEAFELAGGYTYPQRIEQVLSGLGFAREEFDHPLHYLSGGQRTRALLARMLLEEPDLLLLDEPTNHLDLEGVEWLENYLRDWRGAVVVVAHDRAFLDAVAERVWELSAGRLERYRGNYSAYVTQRAERLANRKATYERQRQQIARAEDFIQRNIAGQRAAEARGRRKRLERLTLVERPHTDRPIGFSLEKNVLRSGDLVVGLYDLAVGYTSDAPLVTVDEVELRRGQRVALVGPNGCGKTTLMRTILREIPPLTGRVRIGASVTLGYFAQGHTNLDPARTVLQTVLEAADLTISQARSWLGRYHFSGDDVFKAVGDLSGGEQARVALALLALRGANVLLLDEPTNHLDIPSQEVLQEVLAQFGGTWLLISHDRYLIRRLATHIWAIADGRLWTFEGGSAGYEAYQVWMRQRRERRTAEGEKDAVVMARQRERAARRAAERAAARLAKQREELEARILHLETLKEQLGQELAAASERQDVDRVCHLGEEYGRIEHELEMTLVAWVALEGD